MTSQRKPVRAASAVPPGAEPSVRAATSPADAPTTAATPAAGGVAERLAAAIAASQAAVGPALPAAARPVGAAAARGAGKPAAPDDDAFPCPVFDDQRGRPCGAPVEDGTLTCSKHRVRPTRTQVSRNDAARRRFGG